ncbi:MAG: acetyl-CoA carboxylase biotin carboxyl carrier protein [Pirellulales bacterium]|nr:acetyl-CoA carboxylase biotin carboxyl carrier protein [Pirellulales bacterium]
MADSASKAGDPFDLGQIRKLVKLMQEHDLSAIDLRSGEDRISLRRGAETAPQVIHSAPPAQIPQAAAPAADPTAAAKKDESKLHTIKAPVVGTFFLSAKPGEPPFVKPGDKVEPETTVCIIEAMKVFNEIPAGVSGTIVRALVQNEQAVEYNQALFAIEPA